MADALEMFPSLIMNTTSTPGNFSANFTDTQDDYDTRFIPYPVPVNTPPLWEISLKVCFYILIVVLSLVGNSLVVITVLTIRKMHTATNFFIMNLAISDLLVTVSCTWVHLVDNLMEGWILGAFFCKFNSFSQVLSLVSSIMTLTAISCDRFFGIVCAMKAHVSARKSHVFIILIWVMAIGISSPLLAYRKQLTRQWLDHTEIWCDDIWPVNPVTGHHISRTFYYTFISVVLYFIPILIMTGAYSMISWKLWSTQVPGEQVNNNSLQQQHRMKQRVVIMLVTILLVFALCWLPFQISILFSEYRPNQSLPLPAWYSEFYFFANYIAFANSAFNPIIYTGFNENFKKAFHSAIRFCCRKERDMRSAYLSVNNNHHLHRANNSQMYKNHSHNTQTTALISISPPREK